MRASVLALVLIAVLAVTLPAQGCFGRGNARLTIPSAVAGTTIGVTLEAAPGAPLTWLVDPFTGDFPLPGGGSLCVALTSSTFIFDAAAGTGPVMPATGSLTVPVPIPAAGSGVGLTLYSQFAAIDPLAPGGVAVSDPASLQVTLPDWYVPTIGSIAGLGTSLHTATGFGDGRFVLIAGGGRGSLVAPTPEAFLHVYDHYTRSFIQQPSLLRVPRSVHTATLLDNGRILIVGGTDGNAPMNWDDGELFDPATGTLAPVLNRMQTPRGAHTATKLDDGRVLIAGGNQIFALTPSVAPIFQTALSSTEIYDPATNTFTAGPSMNTARVGHSAVKLANGEVLIVGGISGGTIVTPTVAVPVLAVDAEKYDPVTNTFTPAGFLFSPRFLGQIALLPSGNVLYAGGGNNILLQSSSDAELWLPVSGGTWVPLPNMPVDTAFGTAVTLDNGLAAVTGGASGTPFAFTSRADVSLFDEATMTWSNGLPLPAPRVNMTTTRLADGTYLVAGGGDTNGFALTTALVWNP